jgi:hypothetical protein
MSLAVIVFIEGISLRYRIDLRPVADIGSSTVIPSWFGFSYFSISA